jgi:16S rRNA (adenine1518-N6/adenine1519-N6)-dimethyltransferase
MRFKPKKRLGQNFLTDKNIQKKIAGLCGFDNRDTVVEIGAGKGEMTQLIQKMAKKVYAVEIDGELCLILKEKFKGSPNVDIINRDILKLDLRFFLKGSINKMKVFGNIPYYISSPIIAHLLKYKDGIEAMYITAQKEFANRVTSPPGSKDYGSLTCFVNYHAQPRILMDIKKGSFSPVPKVDSCLLEIIPRHEPLLNKEGERLFFKITRHAFNQRRKTLRNSIKGIITLQKLEVFFENYGIDRNIRPEDLSLSDFINLALT